MESSIVYNRIRSPKNTIADYLQSLTNDDVSNLYGSTFLHRVKIPGLLKKLQRELDRRQLDPRPALF